MVSVRKATILSCPMLTFYSCWKLRWLRLYTLDNLVSLYHF